MKGPTPMIKAETVTLTLTREQLSSILGGLNTGSIARRKEASRYKKNVIAARACEALAQSSDNAFCLLVRARADADREAQHRADLYAEQDRKAADAALVAHYNSIEADGGVSTP